MTKWFTEYCPLFTHLKNMWHIVWIGIAFLLFILIMVAITSIIRYPSETAVIRMVDDYEQTGIKVGFRQGWKSLEPARLPHLVIDLVIGLPAMLFLALLLGLGVLFYFSVTNGANALAIGGRSPHRCAFLFIFLFAVLMVLLSLLRQSLCGRRLEETRIGDSFRRGWEMFKKNWKSAALMWL